MAQSFIPSMMSGASKLVSNYSFRDFLLAFWDMSLVNPGEMSVPVSHQLWFLRDLIVVSAISPLVFLYVKHIRLYGLLLLGFLWCFGISIPIIRFMLMCLFFWGLGSFFALNRIDFGETSYKYIRFVLPVYIIGIVIELYTSTIISFSSLWGGYFIESIS